MHGITPGFSLQRGIALKWLLVAAIAMVAIATMVVAATAQAQSSNAPNPPTGLMAEIVTANSIRIAWQPPASNNCQVSQYNVLVEAKLSNDYIVDDYVSGSQHQYLIENLDPATPHEIRVYAHSEDVGCSDGSTPALLEVVTKAGQAPAVSRTSTPGEPVARKPLNVPSQPQNVGYEIGHNQLTVTWEQSTVSGGCGLVEYIALIVEWDGDPNNEVDQSSYREQKIAANASPAAVFENLKPETAYYTYLAARGDGACDGNGYSPKVEHYFTTKPVPTQAPTAEPTPGDGIEEVTRTPEEQAPMPQVESPTSTPTVTVPGPVGNLAAKQTDWLPAAESGRGYDWAEIYVTWDPPEDDGGRPIIGYDMEIMRGGNGDTIGPLTQRIHFKFGSSRGLWKNDREADMTDVTHGTGTLGDGTPLGRDGQWLEYRIGAANVIGAGEITKVQIRVKKPKTPGPVLNLAVRQLDWLPAAESGKGYDRAEIDVTWDPPAVDGGSPVTGYDMEIMHGGNSDTIGPLTQRIHFKFGSSRGLWENDLTADKTDVNHKTGTLGDGTPVGRDGQWLEYRIGAANVIGVGEITKVQIRVDKDVRASGNADDSGAIYVEVVKDGIVYGNSDGLRSTYSVAEGSSGITTVPVQVRLTGSPSAEVSVQLKFQKPNDREVRGRKNAGANRDFYFQDRMLTWEANASGEDLTKTVDLRIVGDTRDENDETVRLVVSGTGGIPISTDENVSISRNGIRQLIRIIIVDDDGE